MSTPWLKPRTFWPERCGVVAAGTCSSYGGVPAARGQQTQAVSVSQFLKMRGIPTPVINVPGCPPHPDWMVGTLALLLDAMKRKGTKAAYWRSCAGSMTWGGPGVYPEHASDLPLPEFFRRRHLLPVHDGQEGVPVRTRRRRGPWSGCDSATRKWNGGVNWCIANATCVGLHVAQFSRRHVPFYEN